MARSLALFAVAFLLCHVYTSGLPIELRVEEPESIDVKDRFNSNVPLNIGHRGAAGVAPENTMVSYQMAFMLGADAIETDLRLTKDNVVIVMHDTTVDRTTNGTGKVTQLNYYDYIANLDAGSWKSCE
eukprot:Colp12_sorted_trinity150504_noHs@21171